MIVVELQPLDPGTREAWAQALTLMAELEGEWTLVGGLMVQLLMEHHGGSGVRPTDDIDILADSRTRPSSTEHVSKQLDGLDFELADPRGVAHETAYRFTRGDVIVDVLGPDGVGKDRPRTLGGLETIQVKGGTQALARSEVVTVRLGERETAIRCPSLLGAILMKARTATAKDREQDREDLLRLLACVDDPIAMAGELTAKERGWLRRAEGALAFDDGALNRVLPPAGLRRAEAAFRLLTAAGQHP